MPVVSTPPFTYMSVPTTMVLVAVAVVATGGTSWLPVSIAGASAESANGPITHNAVATAPSNVMRTNDLSVLTRSSPDDGWASGLLEVALSENVATPQDDFSSLAHGGGGVCRVWGGGGGGAGVRWWRAA